MMEHIREERLALYAGGDLPVNERGVVTAHLNECCECLTRLREFQEAQNFVLAALKDPERDELAEVREHLAAKLRLGRSTEKRRVWWFAGAAAAAALLTVALTLDHRPAVKQETIAFSQPQPAKKATATPELQAIQRPIVAPRRKPSRNREVGIRSVALIARENQPSILKMTTADPNVVILWQSNERTNPE
jgi:hypothetical protein